MRSTIVHKKRLWNVTLFPLRMKNSSNKIIKNFLSLHTKNSLFTNKTRHIWENSELLKMVLKQTLRVFHLSYFKYILQISFNSFQFISSKFWKSVIFNLFEVSFSHFQWNRFSNKFFLEIFMSTRNITYEVSLFSVHFERQSLSSQITLFWDLYSSFLKILLYLFLQ